jgi:transposase-like protein
METSQLITSATTYSGLSCPKCSSHSIRKHGHTLGLQRYWCKKCGRTFNETVNTALHWIHNKPQMMQYAGTLTEHLSLKKTAERIGISVNTSFSWRHKILSSFKSLASAPTTSPAGVCQIIMPRSYKGKRNVPEKIGQPSKTILLTDAKGIPCLQMLPDKCTAFKVSQILAVNLSDTASIACKSAYLLDRAIAMVGCPMVELRALRKKLTIKTELAQLQLNNWMQRFNGVATKYLQQYWNWFRAETSLAQSADLFINECFAHRHLKDYRIVRTD